MDQLGEVSDLRRQLREPVLGKLQLPQPRHFENERRDFREFVVGEIHAHQAIHLHQCAGQGVQLVVFEVEAVGDFLYFVRILIAAVVIDAGYERVDPIVGVVLKSDVFCGSKIENL